MLTVLCILTHACVYAVVYYCMAFKHHAYRLTEVTDEPLIMELPSPIDHAYLGFRLLDLRPDIADGQSGSPKAIKKRMLRRKKALCCAGWVAGQYVRGGMAAVVQQAMHICYGVLLDAQDGFNHALVHMLRKAVLVINSVLGQRVAGPSTRLSLEYGGGELTMTALAPAQYAGTKTKSSPRVLRTLAVAACLAALACTGCMAVIQLAPPLAPLDVMLGAPHNAPQRPATLDFVLPAQHALMVPNWVAAPKLGRLGWAISGVLWCILHHSTYVAGQTAFSGAGSSHVAVRVGDRWCTKWCCCEKDWRGDHCEMHDVNECEVVTKGEQCPGTRPALH